MADGAAFAHACAAAPCGGRGGTGVAEEGAGGGGVARPGGAGGGAAGVGCRLF